VRGLESLDQRIRDKANQQARNGQKPGEGKDGQNQQSQQDPQNRQGQQPGQSQDGQQSQQGQQGQGQQGQQGQGQQGQQQGQQGQDGQQGQQAGGRGQEGQANRVPQGGSYGGDARNDGGAYYGGRFTNDDVRQFTRQFQELDRDAQQLRQQLLASGVNPGDLDAVMRDLRQGQQQSVYNDPAALAKLQSAALERLKQFEFNLRKKLETGNDSLALSGSDEVPAGFRQAIEEYYRSLALKQGTK
jgi:hypothetical protein